MPLAPSCWRERPAAECVERLLPNGKKQRSGSPAAPVGITTPEQPYKQCWVGSDNPSSPVAQPGRSPGPTRRPLSRARRAAREYPLAEQQEALEPLPTPTSALPSNLKNASFESPLQPPGRHREKHHSLRAGRISYLASTNPKWRTSLPAGAAGQALSLLRCDVTADGNWIKRFLLGCPSRLPTRSNAACVRAGNQA